MISAAELQVLFPETPTGAKIKLLRVNPIIEKISLVRCTERLLCCGPKLKSEEGALSLEAFQFELAKRTCRNKVSQLRVGGFAQAARYT